MKLSKFAVAAFAAVGGVLAAFAEPRYRVEMTTSGYAGEETLANFPVLVKFAKDAPVGFDYSQFQPGQTDLSFEDASGNKLAYEIDTWDEEGTSFVWVKVPTLTAATKIIATWGDPDATTMPGERAKGSVWGAANYAAVWHFGEASGTAFDSTANGLDAVPMGAATSEMVANADAVAGCSRVITTASNVNFLEVANNDALNLGATFTASGWFKASTLGTNGRIFERKNGSWNGSKGWETQWKGVNQVQARGADGYSSSITLPASVNNGFQQIVFVFTDDEVETGKCSVHVYCNGAYVGEQGPTAFATDSTFALKMMGSAYFRGSIDELRLQDVVASADWIKAEYDTVKNTTFYESSAVIDAGSFNTFTVETEIDAAGTLVPAAGVTTGLSDGETVLFSAPETEFPSGDGYLVYTGYRLYVTVPGEAEKLVRESSEFSGSYTHVADRAARLVWKQQVRKGGVSFETAYASIVQVPGYTADETLRNMQVLFRLKADAPEGFSYADCQANGADILFTDADGHVIPHEIERWDPEGESLIWVNLPTLKKGTTFRFCYGNADITEPQNTPGDVWADAGYAGVWHMNEAEASDNALDATANGNDGAPTGADTTQMVHMEGAVGGARALDTTGKVNYFSIADADTLDMGTRFTVGGWFKGSPAVNGRIFCKKSGWADANGWETQWNSATTATPRGSAADNNGIGMQTTPSIRDQWGYVVWVYDGTTVSTYSNGEKAGDSSVTLVVDNSQPVRFGGSASFKGGYDEVRFVSGTLDAVRIRADYDTVADSNFLFAMKVVAVADGDGFLVESGDTERGTVIPAWGKTTDLADGQIVDFSAPAGGQTTDDPKTNFCFTGYELYVTAGGVERLAEKENAVAGRYVHVAGQSARLVWFTRDMPLVAVDAGEGGTVTGAGYHMLGEMVTLTATPAEGMRFMGWSGDLPDGVEKYDATISFVADRPYEIAAAFAEKSVCAAFFGWKGHGEGETVTTAAAANDIGTVTFAASSVNARGANGVLPAFSKKHPAKVIYTDSRRNEVLATNPGSIYFTSAADPVRSGGGDVVFDTFGTWISQQRSCTVEFFCTAEVYQQYAGLWSMALSGETQVFYASDGGPEQISFAIEATTSGTKGRATPNTGATSFVQDAWQHVALVYDRDNQKVTCYRNYGEGGEKSLVITETTENAPLYLGTSFARSGSTGNCFNGWISCLRVTKGALTPEEFMRAEMSGDADGTIALWDFRGKAGDTVAALTPFVGDRELFKAAPVSSNPSKAPKYSEDVPGEAIFGGSAAMEAHQPLSKRVGSIAFTGATDDYLVMQNLSTALSDCDNYTLEFFEKCEETASWKAAISWNDTGRVATAKPNEVQIPGKDAKNLTIQCNSGGGSAHLAKTANLADGEWHHVAVTYTVADDNYTLWYDREKGPTLTSKDLHQHTAAPVVLGTMIGNLNGELFKGKLSCLRVSNRALAPSEFLVAGPKPKLGSMILVR